jgi:DNA-binding Lrp family transcriptional regulator
METIKTTIIKYLEGQGRASKSKIEKEVGELTLSTGDCIARRMRELVAEGVVRKIQRDYEGKKYWEYSVIELPTGPIVQTLKI